VGPTAEQLAAIRENLFPGAHWLVDELPHFPWHQDSSKQYTAPLKQSSQALAVDCFATIARLESRHRIMNAWCRHLDLTTDDTWELEAEHLLDKRLLGEPRSSQLDAVGWGSKNLIVWEAKFTEQDGGGCSQIQPLRKGPNAGLVQCNGRYELQVNPVSNREARCALTGKGVKYWSHLPALLDLDANVDHDPCPIKGGTYQWARNLLAASALGEAHGLTPAFVLVHAGEGFPMATHLSGRGSWNAIVMMAEASKFPLRVATYFELLGIAVESCATDDRPTVSALANWIDNKITGVRGAEATVSLKNQ
jgi:hypothetical protein